ncbi:hypothetical protein ASPCADRAFT_8963 [Aspergillus carbonarius ITEM 5010]|uniref:Alpha/beta hydrolase fold-3 domain-containing protein n=1 Tax=Aspergillus carbonarius (strain ITEM 5010) TaxID=602072 RepID=A0A1R3RCA0_ASPC5|nr:hypothetical protein ASPCADRAFT_8963 [Aspergillus carbonarius ITEM 5010]
MYDSSASAQGPSAEWTQYCIANRISFPSQKIPEGGRLPHDIIQTKINEAWEASSRRVVQTEGLNFHVETSDYTVRRHKYPDDPIPIRAYLPKGTEYCGVPLPVYVHFHGGGFLNGNVNTEDATCARMVTNLKLNNCPIIVISVEYRTTSEAPYPAAFHDAWDIYEFLGEEVDVLFGGDPTNIILGGVDSGAALALWVAVFAKSIIEEEKKKENKNQKGNGEEEKEVRVIRGPMLTIVGLMLCTPWLPHMDAEGEGEDARAQNTHAPILPEALHLMFRNLLAIENVDSPSYVINSLTNFEGLPRTSVLVAGQSLLRDQAMKLAKLLEKAKVASHIHIFPGLPHDFRRIDALPSCQHWDECIVREIMWFLDFDYNLEGPHTKWI